MFPASIEYPVKAAINEIRRIMQPSIHVNVLDHINIGGSVEQDFDPCRARIMNTASSDTACRSLTIHSVKSILTNSINMLKLRSNLATVHATSASPVISWNIYNCISSKPSPCSEDGFPVQNNIIS